MERKIPKSVTNPSDADWRSRIICHFYRQARCRNGANCPFSHTDENPSESTIKTDATFAPPQNNESYDPRSNIPCRFYARGTCLKGENCAFSHNIPKFIQEAVVESEQLEEDDDDEEEDESIDQTWCRELKGALVTFGDGAIVSKVSLPSDFSAVLLSHLPHNTTTTSIVNLLAELKLKISEGCVRLVPQTNDTFRSAEVRVEDPQFAKRLCVALALHNALALDKDQDKITKPKGHPIDVYLTQAENQCRVDSKKVYISWHKATKKAWLNFVKRDIAAKVAEKFSDGTYKVLGETIQCEGPIRSKGEEDRKGDEGSVPWTVILSDLPVEAWRYAILNGIDDALFPQHIEIGPTSYVTKIDEAKKRIQNLLLEAGPFEWSWPVSPEASGKRFTAKARFMTEEDARKAVQLFHDAPLPFNRKGRLTVKRVHSVRLKISNRVYNAVKDEIARYTDTWKDQNLLYTVYPPIQNFRSLRIEGESTRDIARANAVLEKIVRGRLLRDESTPLWVPLFATNGFIYQKMKQVERKFGVVIIRDKRRCQLRALGPHRNCQGAKAALTQIKWDFCATFKIDYDEKAHKACRNSWVEIQKAIGHNFQLEFKDGTPHQLTLFGPEDDYKFVQRIIQGKENEEKPMTEADSVGECPICLSEAEKPVHTSCGHVYCAGCLKNLCAFGATSDSGIRCSGDNGECNKLFALNELKAHLQSSDLEDILESSFTSHISRHPDDLQYCPTADCSQVYRASTKRAREDDFSTDTDKPPVFKCPKCVETICLACRVPHEGMSCGDFREHASGGYRALIEAKDELGIKDCPKCYTLLQKSWGCNHMTCEACGIHICWKCMDTFLKSESVYQHMQQKHGGIGVEYFPEFR